MAIYHCTVKTHSRADSSNNNAVRSAAYRSGSKLAYVATGNTFNYSRKREVIYSEIRTPERVPARFKDRQTLWSTVEQSEKRCDAQLFREIEVALPVELTRIQMIELIKTYVDDYAIKYGMIADFSIHDKGDGNPHCHIMLTMREIDGEEFGKKNRDWNDKKFLDMWRKGWEKCANAALKTAGQDVKIDSRSYADQGIDRIATVHEGRESINGHNNAKVRSRRVHNQFVRESNSIRSKVFSAQSKIDEIEKELVELDKDTNPKLVAIRKKMLKSLAPVRVEPTENSEQATAPELVYNPPASQQRKKISTSLNVTLSACLAVAVYQAPVIKPGQYGIDKGLCINLPKDPLNQQACYSLRAMLGKEADNEINSRAIALQMLGMKYSWRKFADDIRRHRDDTNGANAAWWRLLARTVYRKHNSSIEEIRRYVPRKYREHFDAVLKEELSKSNQIPEQPSYAITKFVRQVKEVKPDEQISNVPQPSEESEPSYWEAPEVTHVTLKPFNPYPDPWKPTKPPNGSGYDI